MTVRLESMDGATKKEVLLWTTPSICEMKAMDWSQSKKVLNHLWDLEVPKPVGRGEGHLLIGSDYHVELLLPIEHRVGKPGDRVDVKTQLGWTVVGQVPGGVSECCAANDTYT